MSTKLDGYLRTDDLCLAALLHMEGYETTIKVRHRGDRRSCIWIVPAALVDEPLRMIVKTYRDGATLVEPKKYAHYMRETRFAMYDELGIGRASTDDDDGRIHVDSSS